MGDLVAESTSVPPAWLEKLEKRREIVSKGRLGHESGAGAACLVCGEYLCVMIAGPAQPKTNLPYYICTFLSQVSSVLDLISTSGERSVATASAGRMSMIAPRTTIRLDGLNLRFSDRRGLSQHVSINYVHLSLPLISAALWNYRSQNAILYQTLQI